MILNFKVIKIINIAHNNKLVPILPITPGISLLTTKNGLEIIRKLNLLQNIRTEGPATHYKKSDTPTMGGIFIIPIALIIGSLVNFNTSSSQEIIGIIIITFGYMLIGLFDDFPLRRF